MQFQCCIYCGERQNCTYSDKLGAEFLHSPDCYGTMILLLTVPEDRAMLRSNLSAGMEVSEKGDAIASLFFLSVNKQSSPFSETPKR